MAPTTLINTLFKEAALPRFIPFQAQSLPSKVLAAQSLPHSVSSVLSYKQDTKQIQSTFSSEADTSLRHDTRPMHT